MQKSPIEREEQWDEGYLTGLLLSEGSGSSVIKVDSQEIHVKRTPVRVADKDNLTGLYFLILTGVHF